MTTGLAPHELGRLAGFIGTWRGDGHGQWGDARFDYVEELEFTHAGKPHLVYAQRTRASDDGRPLHAERGYWRLAGDEVELVLAQGIGVAEISIGSWEADNLLRTRSWSLQVSPSAKPVTAVVRTYQVQGRTIVCSMQMATVGGDVLPHLEARLQRVD